MGASLGLLTYINMMLQPRKFKYKSRQKNRSATVPSVTKMVYGDMALVLLKPFRISAKRIFRLRLFLKRSARKSDFTNRAFWFSTFPHLPMSKKPKGMRMGKGAGKLSNWYTQVRTGKTLIEFKNLRLGRAAHYAKQTAHKLPVPSTFTCHKSRNLKLVGASRTNPSLIAFW